MAHDGGVIFEPGPGSGGTRVRSVHPVFGTLIDLVEE
jgi:hypothetical protein